MTPWLASLFWGGVAGGALLVGSFIGYYVPLQQRVVAAIMAFGSGVLICALSFELVEKAYLQGGFSATSIGFLGGAVVYTLANAILNRHGAKYRKRSRRPKEATATDGGMAIAIGALMDGIPESLVIGLSLLGGGTVSAVAVAAVFISNIPEGLSSSVGMKKSGRSRCYIFGIWGIIAILSAMASLCGYIFFETASAATLSFITAVAAGAILAMIADTMIPEAFAEDHNYAGLITALGFLTAFSLDKVF